MKPAINITLILFASVIALFGCGGDTGESTSTSDLDPNELAAEVGDWSYTREALFTYIASMPPRQRRKYDSMSGHAELADKLIIEELYYLEANKLEMAVNDDVKRDIENATRGILVAAFIKDHINEQAKPTEEAIQMYYESHQDVYTTLEIIRGQHVFSRDKAKLEGIKERIVVGGERLTTMAHKYSEDGITRDDGGDLGFFNPGGYIRGVGYSETFHANIATMEVGKLYGPMKWEKGYSLVRINERRPPGLKPLLDVYDEIVGILVEERVGKVEAEVNERLKEDYDYSNYMQQLLDKIRRTPEELFNLAQSTEDSIERLRLYKNIYELFPDHPRAPEAIFMEGFVHAEELKDAVMAERAFSKILREHPGAKVAKEARWMLKNMGKPLPDFEDVEELDKKLSGDSN